MAEGEKPGVVEPAPTPPPIQPLSVTMIGVRTEGTGAPITNGQVIGTPDHQPNLIVQVISPIVALLVRAVTVFIKALLGGLGLSGAAQVTQVQSLHWATWEVALVSAASVTFVDFLWNLLTIFGNLEKKHPLLTGSI